jgi:nucleotide-binding universal stress UspA family protein
MFTKILVPVDGSPNSHKGLKYAIDLAKRYGSSITLIHVVERPIYGYMAEAYVAAEDFDRIKNDSEKLLLEKKDEVVREGIKVESMLTDGDPGNEILKASEGYDLIVMGSRGMGLVKSLFVGSVSSKIVHQAKKPVLIIRPDEQ